MTVPCISILAHQLITLLHPEPPQERFILQDHEVPKTNMANIAKNLFNGAGINQTK
jgi:hypothetical protein